MGILVAVVKLCHNGHFFVAEVACNHPSTRVGSACIVLLGNMESWKMGRIFYGFYFFVEEFFNIFVKSVGVSYAQTRLIF